MAAELGRAVEGEVRFDPGSRGMYAYDGSVYRQVPIGVVIPRHAGDVVAALEVCRSFDAPVFGRGGGTSLAGQCCNVAVVFDFSKYMHGIVQLDPGDRFARVRPGTICDELRDAASEHGLTFGPDPATHDRCTLGGMIGNNSCGTHSVVAGKTVDNVEELDVVTYDGVRMTVGATPEAELRRIIASGGRRSEIYSGMARLRDRYAEEIRRRYPAIPRRVSGYNLDSLLPENGFHVARALVGSESTLALVLEARTRLVPSPPVRALVAIGYEAIADAGDAVPALLEHHPIALELFDRQVVEHLEVKGHRFASAAARLLPDGSCWLLAEFGGDGPRDAATSARELVAGLDPAVARRAVLLDDPGDQAAVWELRKHGVGSSRLPVALGGHPGWPGWEDAAVAPDRLGAYLRDFERLLDRHGYRTAYWGHFGEGCVHCRLDFDLRSAPGVRDYRRFMEEAADLVVSYGGSLSGEHGDGQARAELLPRMFGPEIVEAFRAFKAIWDPGGRMNPGKIVDPNPLDADLREGADWRPVELHTHFHFREDGGSFVEAAGRCFGVGKCRHLDGGTMCPSFMVTREEKHSTRGRSRLLQEMTEAAGPLEGRWRNEAVREALDLCLACKGCKGDCPVNVDMATYKAEFLSHHYARRLRPRSAYAMGLIPVWARLASRAPRAANLVAGAPVVGRALKALAGVAPERSVPTFADRSFTRWFRSRTAPAADGRRPVLLWPDTFNNHFRPQTAVAATEVLEAAGWEVRIPDRPLCCGRPLYDYGMLDLAKRYLRRTLRALAPDIEAGTPVVGLEPSCVAVFRDEMPDLLAHDRDAARLSGQVRTLSELLTDPDAGFSPPHLGRRALVQRHCHHQAVMGFEPDHDLLAAMGLELDIPDSGCCGMAGSFGYEQGEHYDVSMRCGERVLLPAVRGADPDVLVVADGFSCREQIEQATGRSTLHLAEVLRMASPPAAARQEPTDAGPGPVVPEVIGRAGGRVREHLPRRGDGS